MRCNTCLPAIHAATCNPETRQPGARACIALVLVLVMGCGLWLPAVTAQSSSPDLPDFSRMTVAQAEQIRDARDQARANPASADKVGDLAIALHCNGFAREALPFYTKARRLAPGDWRWSYYVALVHVDADELDAARPLLEEVLRQNEEFLPARYWLALAQARAGESAAALANLDDVRHESVFYELDQMTRPGARGKSPSYEFYASLKQADLLLDREEPRQALSRLGPYLEKYGNIRDLHLLIAQCYRALDQPDLAAKADRLAPHCFALPKPADPLRDELLRRTRDPGLLLAGILVASRIQNTEWALELAERARQVAPEDPAANMQVGMLLLQENRFSKARTLLEDYLANEQADAKVLLRIGHLYLQQRLLDDAEKFLRAALEKEPEDPEVHFRLADVMLGRGRTSEALPLVSEAVSLAPQNLELRYQFGLLLIRADKADEAARQFEIYLDQAPESADGFFQLGEARALGGRHRDAAEAYSRALDLDPDFRPAQRGLESSWEKMHDSPEGESSAEPDRGSPLTSVP